MGRHTPPRRVPRRLRARVRYVALALCAVIVGLTVHRSGGALPPDVRDVLGEALWAAMVAWGIAAVCPAIRLPWRAVAALALCFVVEISQLVHFPELDALRRTTAGHLVLGSGFDPRDLAAYGAGVLVVVILERAEPVLSLVCRHSGERAPQCATNRHTPGET
jgi:hypothetical protein